MLQYLDQYGMLFIASLSATALFTPSFSWVASMQNIVDSPGLHKTHGEAKPLLGGLAIFAGILLTLAIFTPISDRMMSILIAACVLVITGLLDDVNNLKPLAKLSGQIIAASVVVLSNVENFGLFLDLFERFYLPGNLALFFLIGWIVLMVNAFNLIDGLDGLAAGSAAIIFAGMALITILNGGSHSIVGLQIIGFGACAGFLIFNFNPARIFMGDTGSMLLGFLLAVTFLFSLNGNFNSSMVLGSIFIFAYPALDTGFAILRRLKNRTPIFQADKKHIHHILITLGYSVRKTVLVIYLANFFFACLAVILLSMHLTSSALILIWALTVIFTFILLKTLYAFSRSMKCCSTGCSVCNTNPLEEDHSS